MRKEEVGLRREVRLIRVENGGVNERGGGIKERGEVKKRGHWRG